MWAGFVVELVSTFCCPHSLQTLGEMNGGRTTVQRKEQEKSVGGRELGASSIRLVEVQRKEVVEQRKIVERSGQEPNALLLLGYY